FEGSDSFASFAVQGFSDDRGKGQTPYRRVHKENPQRTHRTPVRRIANCISQQRVLRSHQLALVAGGFLLCQTITIASFGFLRAWVSAQRWAGCMPRVLVARCARPCVPKRARAVSSSPSAPVRPVSKLPTWSTRDVK